MFEEMSGQEDTVVASINSGGRWSGHEGCMLQQVEGDIGKEHGVWSQA